MIDISWTDSKLRGGTTHMLRALLLASLTFTLAIGSAQAGLLFVSNPKDAMLDADAPPDIEVDPGDSVDYFVSLSTFNLANIRGGPFPGVLLAPVNRLSYRVKYDPSELRFDRADLDLIGLFQGDIAVNDPNLGTVDVTHDFGNVAANTTRPLDQFFFTVLTPVNDGQPDFGFQNALINTVAPPAGVFPIDQVNEVQPRPVPEPATLLLLGGGLLCLIAVLRWPRRARKLETIQPLLRPFTRRRYKG